MSDVCMVQLQLISTSARQRSRFESRLGGCEGGCRCVGVIERLGTWGLGGDFGSTKIHSYYLYFEVHGSAAGCIHGALVPYEAGRQAGR